MRRRHQETKDQSNLCTMAAEHPLLAAMEQKAPYKLAKQSGVQNIWWGTGAKFPKLDSKGKILRWTNREFSVKKFMVPGCTEAEADAAALEAAKAFRAGAGCQGNPR